MKLELRLYPDPVLRVKSEKIIKFDKDLIKFAHKLDELREQHQGIGISSIQVGCPIQLIIVGDGDRHYFMCNPEIIYQSPELKDGKEGCLSFPGVFINKPRPKRINIKYQDLKGRNQRMVCYDLLARCCLHEHEHLSGILLEDE